jgi:hypothetical protein
MLETRAPIATRTGTRRGLPHHIQRKLDTLVAYGVVLREVIDGEVRYRRNPQVASVEMCRVED